MTVTAPLAPAAMAETAPPTSDAVEERVARLPELREQLGSGDARVQLEAATDIRRVLAVGTCLGGWCARVSQSGR